MKPIMTADEIIIWRNDVETCYCDLGYEAEHEKNGCNTRRSARGIKKFTSHEHIEKVIDGRIHELNKFPYIQKGKCCVCWSTECSHFIERRVLEELKRRLVEEK